MKVNREYQERTVESREQAWIEVRKICPSNYEKVKDANASTPYDLYKLRITRNLACFIQDYGNHLEITSYNYRDRSSGGCLIIRIKPEKERRK